MPLLSAQATVQPLPAGIDLTGKTAVVTGASQGIGLALVKQLLQLRVSTVILAVRNVAKGKACVESLRRDRSIQAHNPKAVIKVMQLDVDSYDSVQQFAKTLRDETPVLDHLILNAGTASMSLERSPSGHERTLQVNYYSNVLLIAELLPYLEASAEKIGSPARITWVGSRRHLAPSIEKKKTFAGTDEEVLKYMDTEESFVPFSRYSDSKLLCVLFMYSFAPRLDPKKVILNMMCPGMVNTAMSNMLPLPLRMIFNVVKTLRARSPETATWIILYSALVAGPESHGKFLNDQTIADDKGQYILSAEGQAVQKKVWNETIAEMSKLTTLPAEFK